MRDSNRNSNRTRKDNGFHNSFDNSIDNSFENNAKSSSHKIIWLLTVITIIAVLALAGCGGSSDKSADTGSASGKETENAEPTDASDDSGTDEAESSESAEEEEAAEPEEKPEIVKVIEDIDTEDEAGEILQIASIVLYKDGSVEFIPTDDLKKNEIKEENVEGFYPFEPSGPVKDVEVLYFGNDGYRTIAALLKDGTISVVNPSALIKDHIVAVMDNVAGRDNFVKVENRISESEISIVGITENGDEVVLDYSLNFES